MQTLKFEVLTLEFRGTVCHVRRTLARSAFHGFSIGFQRYKECKSDRSRQELVFFLNLVFKLDPNSNEYLLAKFGVDTAENEPYKVCSFGCKIRERFDIEPFN